MYDLLPVLRFASTARSAGNICVWCGGSVKFAGSTGVEVVLNLLATLVTAWCAGRVRCAGNIGVCLMHR